MYPQEPRVNDCRSYNLDIRLTTLSSLLTVGRTVDEAAILYSMLENACHSQLLAEAAAANGIPKQIINDEVAHYTAQFAQNPVSVPWI